MVEHRDGIRHLRRGIGRARKLRRARAALQKRVRRVVVKPRGRAYGRGKRLRVRHVAAAVQAHDDAHAQAVHAGPKRAHVVAQALRQHGQHAVHQVDGAPAALRLVVDGRVPRHVVRHVRDVDLHLEAIVRAPGAHGVVEVAGVGGVDGEDAALAHVAAQRVARERCRDVDGDGVRLRERRGGELSRQVVRRDDGLHVEVELRGGAHAPVYGDDARAVAAGVLRDAGGHDVALPHAQARSARVFRDHEEVPLDPGVQRHDCPQRVKAPVDAQKRRRRARDDVLHARKLFSPARVLETNLHLVAAHALADAAACHGKRPLRRLHLRHAGPHHAQRPGEKDVCLALALPSGTATVSPVRALASHARPPFGRERRRDPQAAPPLSADDAGCLARP